MPRRDSEENLSFWTTNLKEKLKRGARLQELYEGLNASAVIRKSALTDYR